MNRIPVSFKFVGNIPKSKLYKSKALSLYNFYTDQADREGLDFISKYKILGDGTIISFISSRNSIYNNRSGIITITTEGVNKKEIEDDIYVTVADRDSITNTDYPFYNNRDNRWLYQNIDSKFGKRYFFAAGRTSSYSTGGVGDLRSLSTIAGQYDVINSTVGSEWRGKGLKCVSARINTTSSISARLYIFIAGIKGEIDVSLPQTSSPWTNLRLKGLCYLTNTDAIRAAYTNTDTYPYIVLFLLKNTSERTFLVICGLKEEIAFDGSKFLTIGTPNYLEIVYPNVLTTPTTGTDVLIVSNFTEDCKSICIGDFYISSPNNGVNQKAYIFEFNDDYTSYTPALVYSRDRSTYNRTIVMSEAGDHSSFSTSDTITLTERDKTILDIKAEKLSFTFLRCGYTSYSFTDDQTGTGVFNSFTGLYTGFYQVSQIGATNVSTSYDLLKITLDTVETAASYGNVYSFTRNFTVERTEESTVPSRTTSDISQITNQLVTIYNYSAITKLIEIKTLSGREEFSATEPGAISNLDYREASYIILSPSGKNLIEKSVADKTPYSTSTGSPGRATAPFPLINTSDDFPFDSSYFPVTINEVVNSSAYNDHLLLNCYSLEAFNDSGTLYGGPATSFQDLRDRSIFIDLKSLSHKILDYRLDKPITLDDVIYKTRAYPITITNITSNLT